MDATTAIALAALWLALRRDETAARMAVAEARAVIAEQRAAVAEARAVLAEARLLRARAAFWSLYPRLSYVVGLLRTRAGDDDPTLDAIAGAVAQLREEVDDGADRH
jgi:hypothetical protein